MQVAISPNAGLMNDALDAEQNAAMLFQFLDLVEALFTGQNKDGTPVEYVSETKLLSTITT